ncbi:MAG: hypothetical protein Q7U88_00760 [Desulfocapsaceae bacterium]|nr:hypothetical protein [Desulfocapsaceae bacterium]
MVLQQSSGFHTEENIKMLITGEVDAYVANNRFRKRDPRFVDADRYKEHQRRSGQNLQGARGCSPPTTLSLQRPVASASAPLASG